MNKQKQRVRSIPFVANFPGCSGTMRQTSTVTPSNTTFVAWVEAYLPTKWHLDPSSHLATTDMGRKLVGCTPLGRGTWVPI